MLIEDIIKESRAEGVMEGRAEGEQLFAYLTQILLEGKRLEELQQATEDPVFRDKLYKELGLQ